MIEYPSNGREWYRGSRSTEGRYGSVYSLKILVRDPAGAHVGLQEGQLPMHAATSLRVESVVLQIVPGDGADDVFNPDSRPESYSLEQW